MTPFLPRALSVGRQVARCSLVQHSNLAPRFAALSITQAFSVTYQTRVGYKFDPLDKPANPNSKKKIPDRSRPLKRPFVPPPTKSMEELASMPYIVRRTPYSQVPIYRKWMSGGNRILVIIKKIDGDRHLFVEDLAKALEVERQDIRLNPTTQQVEIKGNHYEKALDWLLATGF